MPIPPHILPGLLLLTAAGCSAPTSTFGPTTGTAEASAPWDEPPLETVTSVRDGRSGERIPFDRLLEELSSADAVFLGETHLDETTHRLELAVYEGLLERRGGRVVLALEMFERDVQPALDAYVRGEIDENTFRSRARPWSNYTTAYRPMIERARRDHLRVVASNFPTPVRRKLGEGGDTSSLDDAERALVPDKLLPNGPPYWRRVDNAVRGHLNMMGPKPAADDPRLWSTQSLWDNAMGESGARALEQNPGHSVLHVNGGFHTEYWDGTARQLQLRRPDARVRTVAMIPSASPFAATLGGPPVADFVVFTESRAEDVDDGQYTVHVPLELHYRLHVPKTATAAQRVPLLVWLPEDGESPEDALALWQSRVGERCAIAVMEPPYREMQEDLVDGRRWFWPDTFTSDCTRIAAGLRATCGFVLRHQQVDPARVVVAGEGTGATIAAATAVLDGELPAKLVAIAPRRFSKLKDFPLPLPELRADAGPTPASLTVLAAAADETWWTGELAEYTAVGLRNSLVRASDDAWSIELERENAVLAALGLETVPASATSARSFVVVRGARERSWARKLVREKQHAGERIALLAPESDAQGSTPIPTEVRAAEITQHTQIPRASGAFGGTTVLVLPDGLPEDEARAWSDLAANDPLAKSSQFHRMVLAASSGERALPTVLRELMAKSRKNILIVPATWSASADQMRALRASARELEDQMTLSWRPGLGGLDPR